MSTFVETVILQSKTCGHCGGVFALNKPFVDHACISAGGYTCPYCKTGWSWNESEADKLRKELAEKECLLRQSKCETLAQTQLLEKAERKLRRVNRGVCPCCNRTFDNLARHMKTQHSKTPLDKTSASAKSSPA